MASGAKSMRIGDAAVPTLSVVVPATDSPHTLQRCREAIASQLEPGDELLVQEEPARSGPAAARNAAAARAQGDVLVFVDADVVAAPGSIALIRARLAPGTGVDAVFGAYDDEPDAEDAVSRFRNLLHHHVHVDGEGPAETFWAGLGAVRREAFEASGGFDAHRYPRPSIEDIELGMRLRERGGRILLDPRIRGKHLKRWTVWSMVRTDVWLRGVPWVRLQLERGRLDRSLNLRPRRRLAALAAVAAAAAAVARRPRLLAASLLALPTLDPGLYRLLFRSGGPVLAVKGLVLHVVHLLAATASVPLALVRGDDDDR